MSLVVGYVGTKDLPKMQETDIQSLDVINIAFGHVREDAVVWDGADSVDALARIRSSHPKIKILLSIGGWSADGFSQAAATKEGREKFAKTAAKLAADFGLDGMDVDWEYPGTSVAGIGSSPDDKENFTLLLQEMRKELDQLGEGKMLTIAAGGDQYFTRLTDMKKAAEILDYVQLMTYDLQGGFQKVTGHHSALYHSGKNLIDACTDKAVRVFMEAGVPAKKLIIGVPFYSRMWEGVKEDKTATGATGLGCEAGTVGGYGPSYGVLVKEYINKNGFRRYWDEEAKSPYLFDGTTFISYDDEESLGIKIDYMKQKGLLGVMFWEYQCDAEGALTRYLHQKVTGTV